tara:strand:- start:264 stop:2687 length:2424 start_codon:yes stop_codon:yes gene_type:complete
MELTFNRKNTRDFYILLFICLSNLIIDLIWINQHQLPPPWDQATHLGRSFDVYNLFATNQIFTTAWWHEFWNKFPDYRGPFTYLATYPFLKYFGLSYKTAILSNQFFNWLLIFTIYYIAKIIYNRNAGLWSAFLCSISPVFLNQRTDYLIDLSLTSFITISWLFLSLWRFDIYLNKWFSSFLAGIFIGFVFLIKPTGLILLWLPMLMIITNVFSSLLRGSLQELYKFVLFIFSASIISFPWFSQNWLTILISINKARQWGVLYQEGLDANSIEGWLFYPANISYICGIFFFCIFGVGIFLDQINQRTLLLNLTDFKFPLYKTFWWFSFPLGGLLICILMTTKDIRFILPLLPNVFIFVSILILSIKNRWSFYWKISLLITGFLGVLWNQFGFGFNLTGLEPNTPIPSDKWPLEQIIGKIRKSSPYQLSTLAVLADSKNLNAFNLDAEGKRQNNLVAARQTYYQSEDLYDELNNFDWFLIKTGNKGVMSGEREVEIGKLINQSNSFIQEDNWLLPDGSYAYLYRRSPLSYRVDKITCSDLYPQTKFRAMPGSLEMAVSGPAYKLINAPVLIDLKINEEVITADQTVLQGMARFDNTNMNSCFRFSQRLSIKLPLGLGDNEYMIKSYLLGHKGESSNIFIDNINLSKYYRETDSVAINRISSIKQMGNLLRTGDIERLFAMVGQVNQGDPEQIYLNNAERIITKRLELEPNNIEDLYALVIAQTIQRKASLASINLDKLTKFDDQNKYTFIAKAFIDIYRFKPELALISLEKAFKLNDEPEVDKTLRTLEAIANFQSFNLIKAFPSVQK